MEHFIRLVYCLSVHTVVLSHFYDDLTMRTLTGQKIGYRTRQRRLFAIALGAYML